MNKIVAVLVIACASVASAREIHVAVVGDDANPGSKRKPFKTVQAAANVAQPGDVITVHAGVYRERVNPPRGGTSEKKRITYQAARGEKVVLTGAEPIKGWEKVNGDTWKVVIPNTYFAGFNPYADRILGDWCNNPGGYHTGCVYLNGDWLLEARSQGEMLAPAGITPLWFAQVESDNTTIWAQFPGVNPNEANVEINVRKTVFTPEKTGINYITVRGFTLCNAATNWAPPTAAQIGLITAYWSKGWIIEDNDIGYSSCCGVALGKYGDKWDNRAGSAEGYIGTIKRALENGWNKDTIGSHLVRNNHIHHCEQAGIVGSLGCAFSTITGNEIHDIHVRKFYDGAEMAGIKFHGAIDVVISNNHIYRCGNWGGLWLDWMAQGTQVIGNLFHDNQQDLFMEVNHGPFLVANNLFLSDVMQTCSWGGSQGGAFIHNLVLGSICGFNPDGRQTPIMKPHSTEQVALGPNPVGDVRWLNNWFVQRPSLSAYHGATLPVAADGNLYTQGAAVSRFDTNALAKPDFDPGVKLEQKADGWYLTIAGDKHWRDEVKRQIVTSALLGKAVIPNQAFENPDGSPIKIVTDYFGAKRDSGNPFPGPFESVGDGKLDLKVW